MKRRRALVNEKICVACVCCVKVCPMQAIDIVHGVYANIDQNKCVGCGKCATECPASIITLKEAEI